MPLIRLIHWKPEEAARETRALEMAGYRVVADKFDQSTLQQLKTDLSDAIIIDLSRLPAQGREVAIHLRINPSTRYLPVIFVEGNHEKLIRIREILPDAIYSTWNELLKILPVTLKNPVTRPVVPESVFAAYNNTPLPQKLGIKKAMNILLIDPPTNFRETLGDLSPDV